jgi:DNA invertase Pin-like site-specific DNA recombinase
MYYEPAKELSPEEILLYLRKSRTDDPTLDVEEILARHETILDEYAERMWGKKIPEAQKMREIVSGETIDSRPELLKILKLIESPKIKGVLLVEVQRLGRPDLEDIGRLSKLFRYTNTLVITPQKTFDLRNEYDREAFERELMRGNEYLEYTKKIMSRGRLLSVQQGNFIGTKPPYGYDKDVIMEGKKKCHTLKINEAEADVVRMVFDMYVNKDMGRVNIAHHLNDLGVPTRTGAKWSQDTLKTMLENDHYIGKVRWNWRKTITVVEDGEIKKVRPKTEVGEYLVYDGKHPAIISDELFLAAREKQGKNHKAKPKTKVRNPLAGLLFCQCGRSMSLRTYKAHKSPPRLLCDNQVYCKTTSCLYSEIIDRVRETLQQCIKDFEVRIQNDDKTSKQLHENLIKRLKLKLEELNKKEMNQWEKYSEEEMPKEIFEKLNEKVLKEKDEVQQALCKAYESMPEPIDYETQLLTFKKALEALDDPEVTAEKKNRLLKDCIERIDYHREKAVRITSQQTRYYDKELKMTRYKSPLQTGGNWTNPPIELDISLRINKNS